MLDSKKAQVYDLSEYAFSQDVLKDHPRLISVYEKLLPVLYTYAHYQAAYPVIGLVEDSLILLKMQLKFYKKISETKGLVE